MMKAVGFKTSLPVSDANSFIKFETEKPVANGKNLLVKVEAVSVNPVDFKMRQNSAKGVVLDAPKIIGWDAAGIVEAVGEEVTLFKPGDAVYYAGDVNKPGSNAEYQLIDERIVGNKPTSLNVAEAAVMPLTALTAWEIFFNRMRINEKDKGKTILLIGGAGGVGSVAIQIAKKVAGLKVIATASRPETIAWCKELGADIVVNHKHLVNEVRNAGFHYVDFVADFADIIAYWDAATELIKPQGHIATIVGGATPVMLNKLRTKSVSFSWEFMFTRSSFETDDMIEQHHILNTVADLIDKGILKTTLKETLHGLTADNFKKAHQQLESGTTIGKIAIEF